MFFSIILFIGDEGTITILKQKQKRKTVVMPKVDKTK